MKTLNNNQAILEFEKTREENNSLASQMKSNRLKMRDMIGDYAIVNFKKIKERFASQYGEIEWIAYPVYQERSYPNEYRINCSYNDPYYLKSKDQEEYSTIEYFNKNSDDREIAKEFIDLGLKIAETVNDFVINGRAYYLVVICEKGITGTYIADFNEINENVLDF